MYAGEANCLEKGLKLGTPTTAEWRVKKRIKITQTDQSLTQKTIKYVH